MTISLYSRCRRVNIVEHLLPTSSRMGEINSAGPQRNCLSALRQKLSVGNLYRNHREYRGLCLFLHMTMILLEKQKVFFVIISER